MQALFRDSVDHATMQAQDVPVQGAREYSPRADLAGVPSAGAELPVGPSLEVQGMGHKGLEVAVGTDAGGGTAGAVQDSHNYDPPANGTQSPVGVEVRRLNGDMDRAANSTACRATDSTGLGGGLYSSGARDSLGMMEGGQDSLRLREVMRLDNERAALESKARGVFIRPYSSVANNRPTNSLGKCREKARRRTLWTLVCRVELIDSVWLVVRGRSVKVVHV